MRREARNFMRGGSLAILAASLISGCSHADAPGQAAHGPPPVAVDVTHAATRDLATYTVLDGQIAPSLSSALSLQQAGTVTEVTVHEGDRVQKGEVLARIDGSTLAAQLATNQALVTQAQAHLQSSSLTSPINRDQVGAAYTAQQQQLAQARNAQIAADAALRQAKAVYVSDQQLLHQGYVAPTAFESARSAYVSAQQQVASAHNTVASDEAAVRSAKQNLGQVAVQAQDVTANRGSLAQAQAQVLLLQTQLRQTVLTAPFNGVVTARLLDPGAYAGPNQAIVQLAAVDPVYVNFNVPDEDLANAAGGTRVSFVSTSLPKQRFDGVIHTLNATPTDGTLLYRAQMIQSNPGNVLRGGMLVSVAVRHAYRHRILVVPRTAIAQSPMGANVMVIHDKTAHAVPVTVGLQTDALSEVQGPALHSGDLVVATRPDGLADGGTVAIATTREIGPSQTQPPDAPTRVSSTR